MGSDGSTGYRYQLAVDNCGHALMQPWLTGSSNGLLSVLYTDGALMTYRMSEPLANTPGVVTDVGDFSIPGHYILTSSSSSGATLKIMETWTLPTAFLDLAVSQTITIDALGILQDGNRVYFERPVSVDVWVIGSNARYTINLNLERPTPVPFSAGKCRLKFNWVKCGQPGLLYAGPSGGSSGGYGGGGSSSEPVAAEASTP